MTYRVAYGQPNILNGQLAIEHQLQISISKHTMVVTVRHLALTSGRWDNAFSLKHLLSAVNYSYSKKGFKDYYLKCQ